MFLLDTNTIIYYFKGMGQVSQNLGNTPSDEILVPTIVVFELYFGIKKSSASVKRLQQLEEFLAQVQVIPFEQNMAEAAAGIRAQLEKQGQPIGPFDVLIAGAALATNSVLVTHNTREFSRVNGLSIVDWH
ncbi:MAG: type II toxin-antitoxin system VapC family toxin [Pseudanabaena sp. ELA645]|jgi:tRNA(fMet)-specific endonuclease VapC